jgi:acyl-CoA thioesterase
VGDDGVAAVLTAAFGRARESSVTQERRRHAPLPAPDAGLAIPYLPGITPVFVQHFDLRFTAGAPPFTRQRGPLSHEGWCRHRTDPGPSHAALLGLLDAWPSPALQALGGPAPASTVSWSVQFAHVPQRITTDDAFFFRARVLSADGSGYVTMRGELYDAEGLLVAHLEQLVTVYG